MNLVQALDNSHNNSFFFFFGESALEFAPNFFPFKKNFFIIAMLWGESNEQTR